MKRLLIAFISIIVIVIAVIIIRIMLKYKKTNAKIEKAFIITPTTGPVPLTITITPASFVKTWEIHTENNGELQLIKSNTDNKPITITIDKASTVKYYMTYKKEDLSGGGLIIPITAQ